MGIGTLVVYAYSLTVQYALPYTLSQFAGWLFPCAGRCE